MIAQGAGGRCVGVGGHALGSAYDWISSTALSVAGSVMSSGCPPIGQLDSLWDIGFSDCDSEAVRWIFQRTTAIRQRVWRPWLLTHGEVARWGGGGNWIWFRAKSFALPRIRPTTRRPLRVIVCSCVRACARAGGGASLPRCAARESRTGGSLFGQGSLSPVPLPLTPLHERTRALLPARKSVLSAVSM